MSKESLGLIEMVGLAAAVEAADAAVKSANVKLVGYEPSNGGGMAVVKFQGEVGAVNAAVSAATVAASKVGQVVSTRVIARPASGLDPMIANKQTVGVEITEKGDDDTPPDGGSKQEPELALQRQPEENKAPTTEQKSDENASEPASKAQLKSVDTEPVKLSDAKKDKLAGSTAVAAPAPTVTEAPEAKKVAANAKTSRGRRRRA